MKVRAGFVSNSSSSSYVISCYPEDADRIKEAYSKLVDYWLEVNPADEDAGIEREGYTQHSAAEIAEQFGKDNWLKDTEVKCILKTLKKEEAEGRVLLSGTSSNEFCYPEYQVMNAFNEWLLYSLKGSDKQYLDVHMVFERRWS